MAPTLEVERALLVAHGGLLVAIDEVGRGALAGPVTIGAVGFVTTIEDAPEGIDDSKALSAPRRAALVEPIRMWAAACVVVHVEANVIDKNGITWCLGDGARQCVEIIEQHIGHGASTVLLDGKHDYLSPVAAGYRVEMLIGGDRSCASIAAASILAKQERDALMRERHATYPYFGWDRNVGYGTAEHRSAIRERGVTPEHRQSWALLGTAEHPGSG